MQTPNHALCHILPVMDELDEEISCMSFLIHQPFLMKKISQMFLYNPLLQTNLLTCTCIGFHLGLVDRATWGRRLPGQIPPGFLPEPLLQRCSHYTAGYQINPPRVALPDTEVPDGIALALSVATALTPWGGVGLYKWIKFRP